MDYETRIGLEVHVELATKTKIFCGCSTTFGSAPNTQVCPICCGFPGSLPVLNKKVLDKAIALGLALKGKIAKETTFDRKHYFYPDTPQNYQISQLYAPIVRGGYIDICVEGVEKRIHINEMHMEEDAGKLIHEEDKTSLIDFNRAGVPLIEIVSKADMETAQEAITYVEELKLILQYLGVSDCKLQEGSMRVDVNLSVKPKSAHELGVRTEMKNLNSFRAMKRAIRAEEKRQIEVLESGGKVLQETRKWDDQSGTSFGMRLKQSGSMSRVNSKAFK